jgi:isoleucyl-tRNA synthetase
MRWQKVKERIYTAYDKYQFHVFYHTFLNFCINDLSSFYLDIIKDRLYSYKADSKMRRSAQTVLFTLAKEMSLVMAPILSFSADEIWEYMPTWNGKTELVFQDTFPKVLALSDAKAEAKWSRIIEIRKEVNKALELARVEKVIGHPLSAKIVLGLSDADKAIMTADEGIEKIFIVSELEIAAKDAIDGYTSEDGSVKVKVTSSEHAKCERCWVQSPSVGHSSEHSTICERCAEAIS